MATVSNLKTFRHNDRRELVQMIKEWLADENPDIEFITQEGNNDIMVMIYYN